MRGNDKQAVGEVAANIRKIRKPEPYKGKGIRYEGEVVEAQGRQGAPREVPPDMDAGTSRGRAAAPRAHPKRVSERRRALLAVYRSNRHIYAQLIDDLSSVRRVAPTSRRRSRDRTRTRRPGEGGRRAAGEPAKAAGIERVVFDRGGRLYHGRVAAVADGAREGGLPEI